MRLTDDEIMRVINAIYRKQRSITWESSWSSVSDEALRDIISGAVVDALLIEDGSVSLEAFESGLDATDARRAAWLERRREEVNEI